MALLRISRFRTNGQGGKELNLREKFTEVRRRLGYVQKRGHNERHNYNYVTAAELAGSVGDILAELGVIVIPQLQSISSEPPRSSSERIARIVMNYRFVDARSGEELNVRVAGEGADAGDKAPYKAMTGALKYALLQSFLLATGDDAEDERADSRAALSAEGVSSRRNRCASCRDESRRPEPSLSGCWPITGSALGEITESSYRRALELLNRKLAKQSSQENGAHAQNRAAATEHGGVAPLAGSRASAPATLRSSWARRLSRRRACCGR